ncbi:MAG: 4Fe-4S dicluster domain-containing protein [Desulfobaccales bacterium]
MSPDMLAKPTISSTERFSVKRDRSLASEVIWRSGTDLNKCFRCGTCASGCPFIQAMDYPPFGVLSLLKYGMRQEALSSVTIWMCVGCHTCSSQCPMTIDMAAVMDTLRHMALEEGVVLAQPEPQVPAVHRHGCGPLEVLVRNGGLKNIAKRKLNGLKFVPNYGCTSFRPPQYHKQGKFIEGEMERVLIALGAQPLTRTYTNRCCGSFLAASRPDIATPMVNTIIEGAQAVGADCIITACATCQLNLEDRCTLEKKLPVFHFSEILALALGQEYEGWPQHHLVDPQPILQKLGLAKEQ